MSFDFAARAALRGAAMRRRLRQGLGLIWLVDGALQLQPFMWTRQFGAGTLAASGVGQPEVVGAPVRLAARLVAGDPVAFNLVFAALQLAIGLGLLCAQGRRWSRIWCGGSIGWALSVWVLGEGLGGLFTGQIGLSLGAPGAALLYAVISAAAWPSSEPLAPWVSWTWPAVWTLGAALALLPAQRTALGLGSQVDMAAMMSPGVLAGPESHLAGWLGSLPSASAAVLSAAVAGLELFVGLGVLRAGRTRAVAFAAGVLLAILFWIFCQGFGGLSTGTATDPNSGPLLVLLAVTAAASSCVPGRRDGAPPAESAHSHRRKSHAPLVNV